ncbi:MAG TPA: phosphate ABC transporter permease PstA [Acidimicrobiia bacterium]|nr:phosphate ABC transporter permease PstA [Acidimicrobiia bacterium]
MTDLRAPTPELLTPTGHRSLSVLQANARRRARVDRALRVLLTVLMVVASIPLVLIVVEVARRGAAVIDWGFFTQAEPPPRREGGGYAAGFVGTFIIVTWASLMAIPIGILAALYIVDYGRGILAKVIRFFTDVMTGIPSVFVGLAVYALVILGSGQRLTFGAFPGAIAIGIVMLPIVVRTSEEILKTVPDEIRAASFALGARRWQTTLKVVLPAAGPGLATGTMLAVARGAGETAPLILTAFGNINVITDLFNVAIGTLTLQIYNGARQPFAPGIERAWGGALALLVIVLVFTVVARWVGSRSAVRR